MLATVIVLSLVVAAFWKSLVRFIVAAILVLLLVGGIEAARMLGAITTVAPTQCSTGQSKC